MGIAQVFISEQLLREVMGFNGTILDVEYDHEKGVLKFIVAICASNVSKFSWTVAG